MRILPITNYNYQNKTQNNKQQNVNFGMFKCTPADAVRLGKAGFTKMGEKLTGFSKAAVAICEGGTADFEGVTLQRKFEPAQVIALRLNILEVERANVVMSPDEDKDLGFVLANSDFIPFRDLMTGIKMITERAKPVTKAVQAKLTELESFSRTAEGLSSMPGDNGNSASFSEMANRIKQELYELSVDK